MATLTEDFTRMREGFDQSLEDRQQFVRGITAHEAQASKERQEFCEQITAHEAQASKERQEFCEQISQDTATMLQQHRDWIEETLPPFAADLKAGGEAFRGGPLG